MTLEVSNEAKEAKIERETTGRRAVAAGE